MPLLQDPISHRGERGLLSVDGNALSTVSFGILLSGTVCDTSEGICDVHGTCIMNSTGNFCVCNPGYFWNGTYCERKGKCFCTFIDEILCAHDKPSIVSAVGVQFL